MCRSVLFVDRHKPMTIAECYFKEFLKANNDNCWPTHWSDSCWYVSIYQSTNNFLVLWLRVCFFLMCCNSSLLCSWNVGESEESQAKTPSALCKSNKKIGDCAAVTEVVQLTSLIRSNPWIKWKEGKVFWAGTVKSLRPAAGASEKRHVQEMSFNSWRVSE